MGSVGLLNRPSVVPVPPREPASRRTAQLEAANAELRSFAQSLAHDLRAPIAVISGFSDMLDQSLDEQRPEQARHYARRIRAAGKQLDDYLEALLSLARISQATVRVCDVDLSATARSVLGDLQLREPGRKLAHEVEEGLRAQGDPRLLKMVLENLLGNAWKFTGRRGVSEIRFSACAAAGGELVYRVADNGAGFDMRYAGKLFGDFQRLHSQSEFPGTGIGLANVHRIVQRHGGRVWAESVEGEGATFYFTLAAETICADGSKAMSAPPLRAAMEDDGPATHHAAPAVRVPPPRVMDAMRA